MRFAMGASLVANVVLLASKIVAYALSHSKAVLASAADSFVDIASQAWAPAPDATLPCSWLLPGVLECSHLAALWECQQQICFICLLLHSELQGMQWSRVGLRLPSYQKATTP